MTCTMHDEAPTWVSIVTRASDCLHCFLVELFMPSVAERVTLGVVAAITMTIGELPTGILRLADTLTFFAH